MMQGLIEQLYNPLLFYVKNRISSKEDAEDITQEVFFKLAKSNNQQVSNLKGWVLTIAKNTITDYYRKRKVYTEGLEEGLHAEEANENQTVQELSTCIRSFIDLLPEDYREVMILSELESIRQKEIAERLGMNYVTVRSKIQRGRQKLKKMFTDCCVIVQGSRGSILDYISGECPDEEECRSCE